MTAAVDMVMVEVVGTVVKVVVVVNSPGADFSLHISLIFRI